MRYLGCGGEYMANYIINALNAEKEIYEGHLKLKGTNPFGEKIDFNYYYMIFNGKPFMMISGEFQFSRYPSCDWEAELLKIKMGGINTVATYLFWIHHKEEEEGVF